MQTLISRTLVLPCKTFEKEEQEIYQILEHHFLEHKSVFILQEKGTLILHIPGKNKHVMFFSPMHFTDSIDSLTGNLEKILDYNQTTGKVGIVDKLCELDDGQRYCLLCNECGRY